MILSAAGFVQTIVQATLLLSLSALLVRGLIGLSRCASANTQRLVWFLVLVQGIILVPLPLNIPWHASLPSAPVTTSTAPAASRDWADDPSSEHFQSATDPAMAGPSVGTAAENVPAVKITPPPVSPRVISLWQGVLLLWGVGLLSCVAVGLWRYLRFLGRLQTVDSPKEEWAQEWRQLLLSRGARRPIPLRVSYDVGPALIWRPSGYQVVVPEAAWEKLTPKQRQLILCHELAHYEQGDLWRLLAVRLLALPHWFNPLSWWAVRKFEECTEWLCDGAAANAAAGASTIEYARALIQLGSSRFPQTSGVGAAQGSRLFHRIQRLISSPFTEDSRMKKFVVVSLAFGLLLMGSVRIHLVAKEPSATGAMADHKPAAVKPPAPTPRAKKPAEKPLGKSAEKPKWPLADLSAFPDEPAAHAMFNQLIETIQKANSLSYRCGAGLTVKGEQRKVTQHYNVWLKKPDYCRIESQTQRTDPKRGDLLNDRGLQSVLVADGKTFWIYWPKGRPHFDCEDADLYEKTYMNSYLKNSATSNKASLGEQMGHMGSGSLPCFDLSIFHGRKTLLQWCFDAVRSRGVEKIAGEDCDKIEVVAFDQHRWTFWLSKTDHLPRKVEYLFHVDWIKNPYDQIHTEEWSEVTLNADLPNTLFAWQPPKGWTEWRFPKTIEQMLKPGTTAPDFKLASTDGKPIQLSDFRGQPVWLCFWAAASQPRLAPDGKLTGRCDLRRIQKIYSQYKDAGLVVLGYNATDDAKQARETLHANGITFPSILDTSAEARRIRSQDYKMSGFWAKSYVIDRTGKIVASLYELGEDDEPFLEKADGALQKAGGELGAGVQRSIDARVAKSAEEVSATAERFFQALRAADYNKDWTKPKDWNQFPAPGLDYCVDHGFPFWVKWVCNKFKTNPIVDVQLGKVFADSEGRPTVHFRLKLKDGEILQGDLPFVRTRQPGRGSWMGFKALDWHLEKDREKKPRA
jgi:beta-lactamase regulating signal transducer with metallopeptidase domain/peroxiredoxin/outer membrane lipoprotein-sorting protein